MYLCFYWCFRSNLSNANFKGANLSGAVLVATQALGTNFSEATFTGACLEDWSINSATQINDVICDYIYRCQDEQERRPSDINKNFVQGEFIKLFQKA
ncbi:MAG: pentapeptide repeat-containing protein [Rhizonema sp. PD38]|nr:pentapeptide repeat-containing protein [Rhizonema sp. PD37]MDF5731223.1 pentapeptide repeat-containing protein [Rhizonema sp. PD38]